MGQAIANFLFECLVLFFEFRKVRLHRHQSCLLNQWAPIPDKCSADSSQERRYTRLRAAANGLKVFDRAVYSRRLNAAVENAIIVGLCRARWPAGKQTSGGDDQEERRELREQLARPQQEHRDLDAAIAALATSPGSDVIQVQRLKKRKLVLRDKIRRIEDQITPDIIA